MKGLLLTFVLCMLLFGATVQAQQLSVQKTVKASTVTAGENLDVSLTFSNPFGKPLQIRIVDKDVAGGSGIDIQCFDYQLPANQGMTMSYNPIPVMQAGQFTLDKANITYTNPVTGKEEQVLSNSVDITVNPSASPQNGQQSVTTIYQCDGVNMQSTSSSSSSSQSSQNQQSQQQSQNPNPDIQQQAQDMDALKSQMQQQLQEQQQARSELQQKIEQDQQFQNAQKELEQQGYQPASKSVTPESNSSGSFQYDYKNQNNQTESISGNVDNGTVQNLSKWGDEDAEKLAQLLENSTQFRNLADNLAKNGYNLTAKSLSQPGNNISNFRYDYNSSASSATNGSAQRSITGNITVTGNVVSIKLSGDNPDSWWLTPLILVMVVVSAALLYLRFRKEAPVIHPAAQEKPLDFRKEALERIAEAERMFAEGSKKEAYTKVSEGVRLYFKHAFHSGRKELTSSDILKELKAGGDKRYADAKECFELCDLVKFAKYAPNQKDFSKAAESGKDVVSK